jgi:exportin-5
MELRFGEEGWLARISELLGWCVQGDQISEEKRACAIKALSALKSVVHWSILDSLATTRCVQRICETLTRPSPPLQLVSLERGRRRTC